MMQPAYITKYTNNQLRISFRGGLLLRVFGWPFLLVGGYLLYQLVTGIIDSIRYKQMLLEFPGTLLLIAIMLAFGIPGWLMTFTRKHTVIDPVEREVLDVKDFLLYKQSRRYPVSTFNQVTVSNELRRTKTSENQYKTFMFYSVELTGIQGDSVLAAEMDHPDPALELGRQIATMLGLPLRDNTKTVNEDEFEDENNE